MMINQRKELIMPHNLGYDPSDMNDFPYKMSEFSRESLVLEEGVIASAADLDIKEFFLELTKPEWDGADSYRTIDMAARLFEELCKDSAFSDIPRHDLLAACFDQAMTWELG